MLLSSESEYLNNESEKVWSESGPSGTYYFVILLYMLNILLLVFLRLAFLHQQESNPKVVNLFQYFCARFEVYNLGAKFQNRFIFFLSVLSHCFSNHCSLPFNITRRALVGSIRHTYDGNGSRHLYPSVFVQCVNGWDPMDK